MLFSKVVSVWVALGPQLLLRSGTTDVLLSLLQLRVALGALDLLAHLIDVSIPFRARLRSIGAS